MVFVLGKRIKQMSSSLKHNFWPLDLSLKSINSQFPSTLAHPLGCSDQQMVWAWMAL